MCHRRVIVRVAHSIPASLGPLIGRDDEIAEVGALLAEHRLVTLAGPPGIGKTRLALAVASACTEEFQDGAALVELAKVGDDARVPQAIVSALGLREEAGLPLIETLVGHLCEKRYLLVVDNCEHVIDAAAAIVDELARRCADLTLLVTSREPLGIAGETTWRVPPLSLPGDAPEAKSAAVQLFCERAKGVQPAFEMTIESLTAIAEICRRLDGIALAIELAAARVDVLTPQQIAERLTDRFELLTVGSRTALPRHQTLRAALDWSYELLSPQEKLLLRKLAVFVGGWTVDSAATVCSSDELPAGEVLDVMGRLVAKSLVVSETTPAGARYRLLETIRHYGIEKLVDADEADDILVRYARWYVELAERGDNEINGPLQSKWVDRFESELDNVRAALRWSITGPHPEEALRLASAMTMFWSTRGYVTEGREWLEAAAKHGGAHDSPFRARALWGAGFMAEMTSDYLGARELLNESLAIARQAGDARTCARCLMTLAICALFITDQGPPAALALFQQSSVLARQSGDSWCLVCALAGVAWVRNLQGDPESARSLLQECLVIARDTDDREGVGTAINLLGSVALRQGDLVTAEAVLSEGAALARLLGDPRLTADTVLTLGQVAVRQGDHHRARHLFEESLALGTAAGSRSAVLSSYLHLGEVARFQGDLVAARSFLTEALSVAWQLNATCPAALLGLGQVSLQSGDPWAAEALFDRALREADNRHEEQADALHQLALLARTRGAFERAADLDQQALRIRAEQRDPFGTAASLEALAGLSALNGDHAHAARLFGAADSVRSGTDAPPEPDADRQTYDADVALVRQGLPARDFELAWGEGETMSVEEAVALAQEGGQAPQRSVVGWDSLTRAERDVSALVAENLTNREIGERLFVSPRTVQTHLSHVFAKLGIASRRDLAREIARRRGGAFQSPLRAENTLP